jgi:anthranilate phosphoribosyltransferase
MTDLKAYIAKVSGGASLSAAEARSAFDVMMSGEATPTQIGGFLMALRVRGETVEEITGAAETMRSKMLRVEAPADAIDIVGTGGDGAGTFNISTAAAIVTAACGVPVAKHGNRAASSHSGAADVLMALGVKLDIDPARISECIRTAGVGFMFAPGHHAAMKHVGPSRIELGTRTIFNLLGPLSNPAGVKRLLIGVFAREWIEPVAHVANKLGAERVWVVHGTDGTIGLDEVTNTGTTFVAELRDGEVRTFEITPEDAGLARASVADLRGGDADVNAAALRALLGGAHGPYRDIVVMTAAAALMIAGKAEKLRDGVAIASTAIDSGEASRRLERLVAISNS